MSPVAHCLSAHRSCADWRLMPTARPMSVQDAPAALAALAAATFLSSRWPAWLYSRATASTPATASRGARWAFHSSWMASSTLEEGLADSGGGGSTGPTPRAASEYVL